MEKLDIKELYYEADTRKHQQIVAERMTWIAKKILDRATVHDKSKFSNIERTSYVEPVYALNTEKVEYGSERYKELTAQMGEGWEHHKAVNNHHIEYFVATCFETLNDPLRNMNILDLLEMVCDWFAAAQRRGNSPAKALDFLNEKYPVDGQLQAVLRNTLALIES